ncbi:hypothetical protein RDI58_023033 [Solanum bulbocastanum]|uniref:AMP-dependent synthetase/ligase domain-containing protein n=1 Tax=Solanum bulbocastanum TaxID=147425 RepID=A0AAN8Y691_SOLBU
MLSPCSPLKLVSRFADHPEIGTLHDNFALGSGLSRLQILRIMSSRRWNRILIQCNKWMTYREAGTARSAIGSALVCHKITKGSCTGPEAVKYIAIHAAIEAIFCVPETINHVSLLSIHLTSSGLGMVEVVGAVDGRIPSLPSSSGVEIISYTKLLSQGLSNLQPFCPPKPEAVATICYTSGTTGTPKGAVLTHANLNPNVAGVSIGITLYSSDIYISYLPLAHIYERSTQVLLVYFGGASGFYQGDNLKLVDDIAVLSPTVFCSVPQLYNRLYAGFIFTFPGKNPSPIWDRLVFNKIKAWLGGRVRLIVSGASPLRPDVTDFLRICFGCQVIEGYGMTETSCLISNMDQSDILSGHVGSPNPACEIKLVDVPDMNYSSEDQPYPRGEICVRSPIVFQGYYKDEVQTQEHFFNCTVYGDYWLLVERRRIFSTQGEYVAPEKIENVYANSKYVAQCFTHGDCLNSSLVAIVSVDPDMLKTWAIIEGIKNEDVKQLSTDPRAKAAILKYMDTLRGFEFAKAITLVLEPFSMENDLLTPTYKIKRPQARTYFAKEIADIRKTVVLLDERCEEDVMGKVHRRDQRSQPEDKPLAWNFQNTGESCKAYDAAAIVSKLEDVTNFSEDNPPKHQRLS